MAQGEHPNQGHVAQPTVVSHGSQRKKVNILAMGSSRVDFEVLQLMEQRPDVLVDAEVWGINYMGAIKRLDRIIHIDPVHPYLGHPPVKDMCDWALKDGIPFYTSHPHPMYINHVVYPFDMVCQALGTHYFNGSVAMAVGLALAEGYTDIGMFGADFSYPNAHVSESGRANVEFLMGIGTQRGVRFIVAQGSTLMDAHCRQQPYGFFRNPLHPPSSGGSLMTVDEIFKHCEEVRRPKTNAPVIFSVVPVTPNRVEPIQAIPAAHILQRSQIQPQAATVQSVPGINVTLLRPEVSPLTKPNGADHEAGIV